MPGAKDLVFILVFTGRTDLEGARFEPSNWWFSFQGIPFWFIPKPIGHSLLVAPAKKLSLVMLQRPSSCQCLLRLTVWTLLFHGVYRAHRCCFDMQGMRIGMGLIENDPRCGFLHLNPAESPSDSFTKPWVIPYLSHQQAKEPGTIETPGLSLCNV